MTNVKTWVSRGHIIGNFNSDWGDWLEEVTFRLGTEDGVGVYQPKRMRKVNRRAGVVINRAFALRCIFGPRTELLAAVRKQLNPVSNLSLAHPPCDALAPP